MIRERKSKKYQDYGFIVVMLEKRQKNLFISALAKPPRPFGTPLRGGEFKTFHYAVLTLFPSMEGWRAAPGWLNSVRLCTNLANLSPFVLWMTPSFPRIAPF